MNMNPYQRPPEHDPTGHAIVGFRVEGQEQDAHGNWVGADLTLRVKDAGNYLVHIVTKKEYAQQTLEQTYGDLDQPERLLDNENTEFRPPFVVNDAQLTTDIILTKFGHRVVAKDLAESMFYLPPEEAES